MIPRSLLAAALMVFALLLTSERAEAANNFPGTTITGNSGSLTASNTTANSQGGEPTTYGGGSLNSMWYSWTAPANGTILFDTCGGSTNFDTTLQAFTGNAVNALSLRARNDDACGLQSTISVSVTSGTVLRVQVDGYANATGTFTLAWAFTPTAPPPPPAPTTTQACTALTGTWTAGSAASGGIGVTRTLTNGSATWSASATDTMNTINGWSETSVQGQTSAVESFNWTVSGQSATYALTFSKPVTNPLINIDRVGGFDGSVSNSSVWTLTSPGTLFRLAGPTHFETFANNSFNRTVGASTANTGESSLSGASGTAPGTVMIAGTMSSVTFNVAGSQTNGGSGGDAVEIVVCVPQADLSVTMGADTTTPGVGDTVNLTITLTNSGPQAVSGVSVASLLPSGLTFVSATPSQGSYNSTTGAWSVGSLGNGANATLVIAATAAASGTYTPTAEVSAAGLVDPDSDPADGAGDDFASVAITVSLPPAAPVEWVDWISATTGTLCGGTITVTASSGGATGFTNSDDTFDNGDDIDGVVFSPEGVFDSVNVSGNSAGGFSFSQSVTNPTVHFYQLDNNTITFGLSGGQGISLASSNVGQPSSNGAPTCGVGLSGSSLTGCSMDAGDQNTGASSPKAPDAEAGPGELEGAGTLLFTGAFTAISYTSNGNVGGDNTTRWAVGVDPTSCLAGTASLSGSKSVSVYAGSGSNPDAFAIPGEDVVYTISVQNNGTGPTDANTIELIDPLPSEVTFFAGATPEFGGGIVGWSQTGTGITFNAGTDIAFSNATGGPPAGFTACTYAPVSGYDPAVTYVCLNPKGQLAAGETFTLQFRARLD